MEGVTDSISGPKESDVKLEVEENVEICPKSEEKLCQIEEHEHDITEVEPLAGIPASDNVHSQLHDPLLVPSYVDGKIFDLPKGWIVERRPQTSLKYFGKLEKYFSDVRGLRSTIHPSTGIQAIASATGRDKSVIAVITLITGQYFRYPTLSV
ncbi:hypothetical protein V6N12_035861 [Hibiscus sabdariffa]|uniref:Uncharacterized protein n=1 Tax=Hibiscus sabdariffa TaxID=183260 RepID=A0ABR2EPE1_9ROSI